MWVPCPPAIASVSEFSICLLYRGGKTESEGEGGGGGHCRLSQLGGERRGLGGKDPNKTTAKKLMTFIIYSIYGSSVIFPF